MAHSKMLPASGEPTEQNSTCGGRNLDRSVHSARFLHVRRSLGSATSNEANNEYK